VVATTLPPAAGAIAITKILADIGLGSLRYRLTA
jgi:hypothetical protein